VIDVMRNMEMNGKSPSSGAPTRSNTAGVSTNMYFSSVISTTGTSISRAIVLGSRRS